MENIALRQNLMLLMGNMSEAKFARAVNLPKATINRLLSGRTPDPRAGTLLPIAQYFGISLEQLLGVEPLSFLSPLKTIDNAVESILKLPFIEIEKIIQWHHLDYHPDHFHSIVSNFQKAITPDCYITQVKTASMQPKFYKNDFIVVNPRIQPKDQDYVIYYIQSDDKIILRKMIIDDNQSILTPLDLNADKPITCKKEDIFLGLVIKSESYLTTMDVIGNESL